MPLPSTCNLRPAIPYSWQLRRIRISHLIDHTGRRIAMKSAFVTGSVLCLAMLAPAVEARADCHYLRGSIAETRIFSNDALGRLLGTVTGVLNGSSTVFITSPPPNTTSYDVFLTTAGDVLIATGVPRRTPIPGQPGEFISHVDLTIIGGFGKYADATGTMTFDGTSHTGTVPQTADLVYKGTVCGPNVKGGD
jgi:hypothetical protein